MDGTPNIAKIGALLGDNTRARMLSSLMHGKALTASELAREAGITAQTATTHLARLEDGGLLTLRKQGRHKYFSLAGENVAALLETLMGLSAGNDALKTLTGPKDAAMRNARICYNHLAGSKGIQLYDSLLASKYIVEILVLISNSYRPLDLHCAASVSIGASADHILRAVWAEHSLHALNIKNG